MDEPTRRELDDPAGRFVFGSTDRALSAAIDWLAVLVDALDDAVRAAAGLRAVLEGLIPEAAPGDEEPEFGEDPA